VSSSVRSSGHVAATVAMHLVGRLRAVRRVAALVAGGFVTLAWALGGLWLSFGLPDAYTDFVTYYAAAALRFRPGGNIYDTATLIHTAHAQGWCAVAVHAPYLYPSLLAILFEPLTLLPCGAAYHLWVAASLALYAGCAALLAARLGRLWPGREWFAAGVVVALALLCAPVFAGIGQGQVHLMLLAALLAAPELEDRGHPLLAGALLALAACVKPHALLVAALYALRGRWRIVAGVTVGGVALVAVMALLGGGPAGLVESARAMLANGAEEVKLPWNEALWALPAEPAGAALVAALWLAGAVLARRRGTARWARHGPTATMVLASPVAWVFYLGWLLPAFVVCLGWARDRRLITMLAVLYTAAIVPFGIGTEIARWLHPAVELAVWALCGVMYLRSAGPRSGPARKTVGRASAAFAVAELAARR
jgi:Glycosyltransferase family 87